MKRALIAACLVAVVVGGIIQFAPESPKTEVGMVSGPGVDELLRQSNEKKATEAQFAVEQAEREAAGAAYREQMDAEARAKARTARTAAAAEAAKRAARSRPRQAPAPAQERVVSGDVWGRLAACESGGNPRAVGGGGRYFGAFQFSLGTWRSVGGTGNPIDHPYGTQLAFAQKLQARSGWGQWPYCARKLGLRAAITAPHMSDADDPLFAILDERPPVVVNNGPSFLQILAMLISGVWAGMLMERLRRKVLV